MSLQPTGFDLTLKYKCDCDTIHYLSLEQAKANFVLVCDVCSKVHKIKKVVSTKLIINFGSNSKTKKVETTTSGVAVEAHKVLRLHGFSLSEIENFQKTAKAADHKTLIQEFLASK